MIRYVVFEAYLVLVRKVRLGRNGSTSRLAYMVVSLANESSARNGSLPVCRLGWKTTVRSDPGSPALSKDQDESLLSFDQRL